MTDVAKGRVVIVSNQGSTEGGAGGRLGSSYAAARTGVAALSKGIALDMQKFGVPRTVVAMDRCDGPGESKLKKNYTLPLTELVPGASFDNIVSRTEAEFRVGPNVR